MGEWKETYLGEYADVLNGFAFKSEDFSTKGVPVIKIKNVASGKIKMDDVQFYPHELTDKLNKFLILRGSILIAMTGSHATQPSSMVGRVSRYDLEYSSLLNQRVGKIYSKDLKKLNETFLYYFLVQNDVTLDLAINAGGSANQANIAPEQIKSIPISLPAIEEQESIAFILSSLDDKIDLLQCQNKTLEALAETLFRQWFVEEAEEGWEGKTISDVIEVRDGTHDSPKPKETGYFLITSKHLKAEGIDFNNAYKISEDDYISINKRSKVNKNDILFSMIGTLGLIYYVQDEPDYAIKNIGLFKSSQHPEFAKFLYLLLKSPLGKRFIYESADGSTQEYISLGSLRDFEFKYPGNTILKEFDKTVTPFFEKIFSNNTQIRTLTRLRDTLLPKLMSGEIRVKDLEKFAETAP